MRRKADGSKKKTRAEDFSLFLLTDFRTLLEQENEQE